MTSTTIAMTDALAFYAEQKNWRSSSTGFALQYDPDPRPIDVDHGKLASAALEDVQVEPVAWRYRRSTGDLCEWHTTTSRSIACMSNIHEPLFATPQEAAPGMDDKNIANRLDRWFIEGLHAADLRLCPYNEDTLPEKWWMRGCNHAIMLKQKEACLLYTSDAADE